MQADFRRLQAIEREIVEIWKHLHGLPLTISKVGGDSISTSKLVKTGIVVSTTMGYITCTVDGENVNVRNPNHMAEGSVEYIDGTTVTYSSVTKSTRIATVGSEAQNQVLTPDYYVGEKLYLRYTPGDTYEYVDENAAGRQWAEDLTGA